MLTTLIFTSDKLMEHVFFHKVEKIIILNIFGSIILVCEGFKDSYRPPVSRQFSYVRGI